MRLLDGIAALASKVLGVRDAPPPFNDAFSLSFSGIPAHPKAAEGQKVYQQNPWVYAAINAIVNEMAFTNLFLRKKVPTKDGFEFKRINEHQALELLENPMPKEVSGRGYLTSGMLKQITGIHMFTSGEAFWVAGGRVGAFGDFAGVPTELHPLVPQGVEVKLDETNNIGEYVYTVGGKQFHLDPKNVVHFKFVDPRNPYRGQSPLLSAGVPIDTERESDKYLWNWFRNNATPAGIVHSEKAPTKEEQERIRDAWQQKFGGADGNNKVGFLWGTSKFEKINDSQREMQFQELKDHNMKTILANLRVGKGILGMMEDQSRANAEAQDFTFGKRTVLPFMLQFVEQLTTDYLPLFGGIEGLQFWFNEEDIVPQDEKAKIESTKALFDIGAMSPNEARARFNVNPRDEEGADLLWMPINRVPIDTPTINE